MRGQAILWRDRMLKACDQCLEGFLGVEEVTQAHLVELVTGALAEKLLASVSKILIQWEKLSNCVSLLGEACEGSVANKMIPKSNHC